MADVQFCRDLEVVNVFLRAKSREANVLSLVQDLNIKLDKLMEIDQALCETVRYGVTLPVSRYNSLGEGDLILGGSCGEGCMLARWFKGKPKAFPPPISPDKLTMKQCADASDSTAAVQADPMEAVNVGDLINVFLAGPARHMLTKHPERAQNLQHVGTELLQAIFPQSSNTLPPPAEVLGMSNPPKVGSVDYAMLDDADDATVPTPATDDPWEVEMDVMGRLGSLTEECRELLEPVPGRPAYVMIPFCELTKSCVQDTLWSKLEKHSRMNFDRSLYTIDSDGYFDPWKIKRILGILAIYRDGDNTLPIVLAWLFGISASQVRVVVESEPTKTSHQMAIKAQLSRNLSLNLAADLVAAFHVDYWPKVAEDWKHRNRRWPSEDTISNLVTGGCYLVPRPSDGRSQTKEFRWSFLMIEQTLAHMMKPVQRRAYFILKMLFYRYITPLHEQLCSYMTKTTMLWVCEQFPPDDSLWSPEALLYSVNFLLLKLQVYFWRGHIPLFFIPEINLLEDIPKHTCVIISKKIASVRKNLMLLIPFDIPEIITSAKMQSDSWAHLSKIIKASPNSVMDVMQLLITKVTGSARPDTYNFNEYWKSEAEKFHRNERISDDDLD